ncbi:zinc finger protein 326 [Homo sapiens]|uniref:DBIRD complex subunit ZNF326 n=1 Tax=Homo sapiens TaxID=9606 RepID=A0A0A0MRN4_HUMAN|nr:DBIRD complex subunit ZNF326 isoform 4 [Homo sapiens]EAW73127.1 zinc finger protein 326, isoform CRA_c [Homo sapiens]KAI4081414.1 zinc finger protein 326 [Homo sapiens]|eukprot:NP_001307114.1 DBIRD complex subunit ZNF326 isoform 4 [Homo sapiens]
MDFEDDYTHSACRNTYQGFNGMDRDYGPGSYGGMDRDYGHGSYGGQRSMDSYLNQSYGMDNHSGGGGGSSFSSPHMKPAPVGSRGRGTPAYPESTFGSRNYDAFGGPSTGRGRGRGHMGDFGSIHRPGIVVDYQNKSTNVTVAAARGIKRKMMQPFNKPSGTFIKKPKLAKPMEKISLSKSPTKTDPKNEEEEKRRIEARREKQRRRREKNSEKYGDGYRMAFTCSFCKFRTFEEKDIELHLESSSHQETLDHIQKQTKFDKVVMEFLHECMVNKFKKTSIRKQQTNNQTEVVKIIEKDVMEGVTVDDHMMKVETVHCSACSVYIPALHSSVQQHLKSPDHIKGKQAYKEQIKRESVLTATSILNNPIVKARYERFVKGENPFEIQDHSQDQQIEGDEEDEEKIDEPIEEEEDEDEEEEAEEVGEVEEVEEVEEVREGGIEGEGNIQGVGEGGEVGVVGEVEGVGEVEEVEELEEETAKEEPADFPVEQPEEN